MKYSLFTYFFVGRTLRFFAISLFISLLTSCSSGDSTDVDDPPPAADEPPNTETSCSGSISISIDEMGGDYLKLSWDTNGDYEKYNLEYGLAGFSLGEGVSIDVNSTETELTKLDVNSDYEVYVRGVCSDNSGSWTDSFAFTTLCSGEVYEGSVILETQSDVDAFGSLCISKINGLQLSINGLIGTSDRITSLAPLSSLTEVVGDLSIMHTDLVDLDGLQGLKSVNHLRLHYNPNLTSIEALSGLENISALTPPIGVGWDNYAGITISSCEALTNLEGLQNLSTVNSILIRQNFALENLNGLRGLTNVTGIFSLDTNIALSSLSGLSNLNSVGQDFKIKACHTLVSLEGLQNLSNVGMELIVRSNNRLESMSSISNILSVDILVINDNQSLVNLEGVNLEAIQSEFFLSNNSIENLNGITGVETTAKININFCTDLVSLSGIEGLERAQRIILTDNNSLVTLTGLEGVESVETGLHITYNSALSDYCAVGNLINSSDFTGDWNIASNLHNPTLEDMQNGICSFD